MGLEPRADTLRTVVTDQAVVECHGVIHTWSEYTVSVIVGREGAIDFDGDIDRSDLATLLALRGSICPWVT